MRRLTLTDRLEALMMGCSLEEFAELMERARTIERLRGLQQPKPKRARKPKEPTLFAAQKDGAA